MRVSLFSNAAPEGIYIGLYGSSRICNYAFQVNGMGYRAKPVVGYVSLYGVNLCRLLQAIAPQRWKNFVKDHDFVELKLEDRTLFFDASLYDFNLDCTTTTNNS